MQLVVKNIGKVRKAKLKIDGITVIAGENASGKSTLGKILYAFYRTLYDKASKIKSQRISFIQNKLNFMYQCIELNFNRVSLLDFIVKEIYDEFFLQENKEPLEADNNEALKLYNLIKRQDPSFSISLDNDIFKTFSSDIKKLKKLSDLDLLKSLLDLNLSCEFNNQINNVYTDELCNVSLQTKSRKICATIAKHKILALENDIVSLQEPIFIDNTIVLDEHLSNYLAEDPLKRLDHLGVLREQLERENLNEYDGNLIERQIFEEDLSEVFKCLSTTCSGQLVLDKGQLFYQHPSSDKLLVASNLSEGVKYFAIIKKLLSNGVFKPNGLVILDEAVNNIHPQLQITLAKFLVMLQQKLNLKLLIITNSPYLLQAIEVETATASIADKCKYYLAKNSKDNSILEDVSCNIELIYATLAKPFQVLEDLKSTLC